MAFLSFFHQQFFLRPSQFVAQLPPSSQLCTYQEKWPFFICLSSYALLNLLLVPQTSVYNKNGRFSFDKPLSNCSSAQFFLTLYQENGLFYLTFLPSHYQIVIQPPSSSLTHSSLTQKMTFFHLLFFPVTVSCTQITQTKMALSICSSNDASFFFKSPKMFNIVTIRQGWDIALLFFVPITCFLGRKSDSLFKKSESLFLLLL